MDSKTFLEFFKNKKKIIIIIGIIILSIALIVVLNAIYEKHEEEKRLESIYREYDAKAQQCVDAFKSEFGEDLVSEYGEEYSNYQIDITHRVIVLKNSVCIIFYLEGEGDTLKHYASLNQKEYFCGFRSLDSALDYYDYAPGFSVEVYINDEKYFIVDDIHEELERVAENRNTCKYYCCYKRITRSSGYCSFHDTPGWKSINE